MQFITIGNRIMTENFSVGLFYTITFLNGNILACSCNGIGENFVSFLCVEPTMQFILDLSTAETIDTIELYGGGAGTMNYNELDNKPSINGETLVGNLTTTDLHIRAVPPIDTTDNNKVLTASYAGGVTSYSWQTVPTGTTNYQDLTNKPEINGHVLSGNQLASQLGLATSVQGALADTAVQPADLASYQPLIDSSHKLSSDLVDDTNHTNKFATQSQLDQIETNKNNILYSDRNKVPYTLTSLKAYNTSGVWTDNTYTVNNLTFTINNDMSITVTASDTITLTDFKIGIVADLPLETGVEYWGYGGLPTSENYWGFKGITGVSNKGLNAGSIIPDTLSNYTDVIIRISSALGAASLTFKPMIVKKSIYDSGVTDYIPYQNAELFEMIKSLS